MPGGGELQEQLRVSENSATEDSRQPCFFSCRRPRLSILFFYHHDASLRRLLQPPLRCAGLQSGGSVAHPAVALLRWAVCSAVQVVSGLMPTLLAPKCMLAPRCAQQHEAAAGELFEWLRCTSTSAAIHRTAATGRLAPACRHLADAAERVLPPHFTDNRLCRGEPGWRIAHAAPA